MTGPWWTRPRDTWTLADHARYAWLVARDVVEQRITAPVVCAAVGHVWDSDRLAGPAHERDICWRCSRTRKARHA